MEINRRVSALIEVAPEIVEMDMSLLIGTSQNITDVDALKLKKVLLTNFNLCP